ncbi:MAG: OadG family protein [Sulfurimonas sp.]|jgi:oxaloacetate decarboxylase (Na+ extruding) subunit gamma
METNLVIEGIKFMFLGMGTVFAFLIIMILVMNVMSSIVHKFFPEPQASTDVTNTEAPKQDSKNIVAAITAAIKYHREG